MAAGILVTGAAAEARAAVLAGGEFLVVDMLQASGDWPGGEGGVVVVEAITPEDVAEAVEVHARASAGGIALFVACGLGPSTLALLSAARAAGEEVVICCADAGLREAFAAALAGREPAFRRRGRSGA